ncbi:MAG: tryptophan--tRNA ligase [Planctomycetes bacterium]|nr:tryptophan--tRNA ligase [Planctomycetota bacterium]
MTARPVSLTGIKPTGTPHLGNLFGAILPAIRLTERYRGIYFIADYHSLTTERDGAALRHSVHEVAATWMAMGLDHENHVFFRQSDVPEVCELSWVLSCFTSMGLLTRAHAYKDAVANGKDPNHGLFAYPVLMAADILLYDSEVVPVGKDQKQHVEMCREIAQRVNHHYGEGTLVLPEPLIDENVATIPGLDGRKMSKSYDNAIEIFTAPKPLRKRFMKIVTGSETMEEPKDPANCRIFDLYKLVATAAEVADLAGCYRAGNFGYGEAKQRLFEAYERFIAPRREVYDDLMANPAKIEAALERGAATARATARRTMERLRERCGLGSGG